MPQRLIPLINEEIYHVVNRGVNSIPIFKNRRDYQRFIQTFLYYQHDNPPIKYSALFQLSRNTREDILTSLNKNHDSLVEIIAYCLMPNHYHFLLKQIKDGGIVDFIRLTTNSYSKYFNTKNKRAGPLFQGRFKTIHIETDEQLIHVSRYIHLNPYSSFIIKKLEELAKYPYSSLSEFSDNSNNHSQICKKDIVLKHFKSSRQYLKFVVDNADYQRNLERIKHLVLED